jgi:hypothetical protein
MIQLNEETKAGWCVVAVRWLQACHDENPELQQVSTITLLTSLKCISLRLWDEESQKLVSFAHLKKLRLA